MNFKIGDVDIYDGDVWIVEICYGGDVPTFRHILRAEIETEWIWSTEEGVPNVEVPIGVTWWAFSSDVPQIRHDDCNVIDGAVVKLVKLLYRHEEGKSKCL